MNRSRRLRFTVSAVVIAVFAIIALYFSITAFITRGLAPTIKHQIYALQTEDYVSAYADTSKKFQETTSLDKFIALVQSHSILFNNKDVTILSKKVVNGTGIVRATISSRSGINTTAKYNLTKENGNWKINSIILYKNKSGNDQIEVDSQTGSTASVNNVILPNNYSNERFSFTVNYPADWEYTQPNNKSVLFSTKNSVVNASPAVTIQPVLHQDSDGKYRSVSDIISTVTNKMNAKAGHVNILERGKVILNPSRGERLDGRYVILSYTYEGKAFKQLEVVFYKEEDRALYVLEYNAPAKQFNDSLPIAKAMTQSFIYE